MTEDNGKEKEISRRMIIKDKMDNAEPLSLITSTASNIKKVSRRLKNGTITAEVEEEVAITIIIRGEEIGIMAEEEIGIMVEEVIGIMVEVEIGTMVVGAIINNHLLRLLSMSHLNLDLRKSYR